MKKCNRLHLYHSLFSLMVENPRIGPKEMARRLVYSGTGRAPSTLLRHLNNMYKKGISQPPRLVVKPFEDCFTTIYLCEKIDSRGAKEVFNRLRCDDRMTYIMMLSGEQFLITSRECEMDLREYGLKVKEKSVFYTPIYVIPGGWNTSMNAALENFVESDFKKGLLPRTLNETLDWTDLDWEIYNTARCNIRVKISALTRQSEFSYNTVKSHFYERVLPSCTVAHFFYPKSYGFYQQIVLKIRTEYEESIVRALKRLPCTSYVFLLEKELIIVLFHERTNETLDAIQKIEERAIFDDCLLYNPLLHHIPD